MAPPSRPTPDDLPRLPALVEAVHAVAIPEVSGPLPAERLARRLREGRFDAPDRRLLAQCGLGLAQAWGRIAWRAGEGASSGLLLATWLVDDAGLDRFAVASVLGVPLQLLSTALNRPWPASPVERLAVEAALPGWMAARWLARFGFDRARSLGLSMNGPAPIVLRANLARTGRAELQERLENEGIRARPGAGPASLVVEGPANLFGSQSWREGLFEVQDEASQRVVDSLALPAGACVIDLCAGSGGKTLALAARRGAAGRVIAVEPVAARRDDLRGRLRRTGLLGVELRLGSALDPGVTSDLAGRADLVLVDAPCSSVGVWRRSPGRKWVMPPEALTREVPLQSALLASGARLVRPGGLLAFATCSTEPEEGESVTDEFEDSPAGSGFKRVDSWRTFPDLDDGDGFFFRAFRASGR